MYTESLKTNLWDPAVYTYILFCAAEFMKTATTCHFSMQKFACRRIQETILGLPTIG